MKIPATSTKLPRRRNDLVSVFLEALEPRIAPAGLADIEYRGVTLGNPQVLRAGEGLSTADGSGAYLLAVEKGTAMIFTTDLNGNNAFDWNEITGIAAGDGLRLTLFADLNGDIVTNLRPNLFLSDSDLNPGNDDPLLGGDGLVLLNSRIESITLRSVTDADFKASDKQNLSDAQVRELVKTRLALSSYSIHGNILAGGGIGTPGLGFDGMPTGGVRIDTSGLALQVEKFDRLNEAGYQLDSILPQIGSLRTGTAAAPVGTSALPDGQFFSFGYETTGTAAERGQLVVGGYLQPFVPQIGQIGGDIQGFVSGTLNPQTGLYDNLRAVRIDAIMTGDGGLGARGGNIENIVLFGDSGGLRILAGNGGDGPTGGAGGSIVNLQDLGSTNSLVQIRTGDGGAGFLGNAGAAGQLSFGRFEMNGEIFVGLGSGGAGFTSSGAGTSLLNAEFRPTDANGTPTAVSVLSTYRDIGDIGRPRLIDFNNDGFSDLVYLTHNPDQIIIKFGTDRGILDPDPQTGEPGTPTLYLAAPAFSPLTGQAGRPSGVVVGDFNNDGWLDLAVAPSLANSFGPVRVFLNPGDKFDPGGPSGWEVAALSTDGGNYIDSYITSPLPMLGPYAWRAQSSGMPIINLATGDFTGDGTNLDLGVVAQAWRHLEIPVDRPFSALVMLTGMGDGRFFADFDYDRARETQRLMPVLNGQATGSPFSGDPFFSRGSIASVGGHYETRLEATSGRPGDPLEILVVATLKENRDGARAVISAQFNPLLTDPQVTGLQVFYAQAPAYYSPIIVQGAITGWNGPFAGTPSGFSITDFEGDGLYDIVVISQGNNLSVMTPLFGVAGYNTGIVMTGARGSITIDGFPYRLPIDFFDRNQVAFQDVLAGNFGRVPAGLPNPSLPTSFALYSLGAAPAPNLFYTFSFTGARTDLPGGESMVNLTHVGLIPYASNVNFLNTEMIAWDKFATLADSPIYGVVSADPFTAPNVNPGFRAYALPVLFNPLLGYVNAPAPPVFNGLNVNALSLVAGAGGNSFFGSGGTGGSIGQGILQIPVAAGAAPSGAVAVFLPANRFIQPAVSFTAGAGGGGFVNGGAGGSVSGFSLAYVGNPPPDSPKVGLAAGRGGDGLTGNGGAGGNLREFSVLNRSIGVFEAGAGGLGQFGGAGGSILGGGGRYGVDTSNLTVLATAGSGGDGLSKGGAGGGISRFLALFPDITTVSAAPYALSYIAGRGGNAVAGAAGVGGTIRDSSPFAVGNNLGGPVFLQAGAGGDGLQGGAGGGILNFINPAGSNTVTIVSAVAGRGGYGVTGAGGAGGSITNFDVSARGIEARVDGEFNRIVAGDGGDGYGSTGGAGGSLVNVRTTANNSAAVAVAGDGGDGLLRGGAGGDVRGTTLDSTQPNFAAKVIVFAGHGGAAYAATAAAPGVALIAPGNTPENPAILALRAFGGANGVGGNGGSIVNFSQPSGVQTAVDLVAGNGGNLVNYGSIALNTATTVGTGGSITGVSLRGEAGRVAQDVAIRAYSADFVDRIILNGWGTLLTDAQGNVGVVVGEAGRVKDGQAGDGPTKNGSVANFRATSIMSMIAGSVDRVAAIKSVANISLSPGSAGVLGAYKTDPIPHGLNNPLYFDSSGRQVSSVALGGRLMDGAIVYQENPAGLAGPRVFAR